MSVFAVMQRFLLIFLLLAIVLPIASIFLFVTGTVINAFGDQGGASLVFGLTTGSIIIWLIVLVGLVLLLAMDRLIAWENKE